MRKVQYTVYEYVGEKHTRVTKEGIFHRWGDTAHQESMQEGGWIWVQYTQAIIETSDGSIIMTNPNNVKFLLEGE